MPPLVAHQLLCFQLGPRLAEAVPGTSHDVGNHPDGQQHPPDREGKDKPLTTSRNHLSVRAFAM